MMDYALMTDDELTLEIARRKGWTNVRAVARSKTIQPTFLGFPPGSTDGYADTVPRWPSDDSAALELLKEMELGSLGRNEENTLWMCNAFVDGYGLVGGADDDNLCHACCRQWLMYTDVFPTVVMRAASTRSGAQEGG